MLTLVLLSFAGFLTVIIFMSLGVIIKKKKGELKGSCGGPELNPECCKNKNKQCDKKI
jgi:hypothetical protein